MNAVCRIGRSAAALGAVVILAAAVPVGTAAAVTPPTPDLAAAPADTAPGPEGAMRKNAECAVGGVLANSDIAKPPPPSIALGLEQAHKFSTGAGVVVGVIDTGVRPQSRLPGMIPGGDYVESGGNGFADCDGHGTLVAGIIGAAPSPSDGLIGVAPNAQILAIRQTSLAYSPENLSGDPNDPNQSRTAGDIRSLARAIVHAANLGARVINVSVVSCVKTSTPIDQTALGAALKYAVDVKDALVVAAAGNVNSLDSGAGNQNCKSNPEADPAHPDDPRNWNGVTVVSTPSWFDDLVLSVGFVSPEGVRADSSMAGPWVDVAAPGTGIVLLSNGTGDGVINGVHGSEGELVPIAGSSYATAYVSGLAALLRSKFPQLTARQVATRIITTAHAPARGVDNLVGHGMIDPVAALTYDIPITGAPDITVQAAELALPKPPPPADNAPKWGALITVGAVLGLATMIVVGVVSAGARRRER